MFNLLWSGAVLDPSGYGEASREYLRGLDSLSPEVAAIRLKPRYFYAGEKPRFDSGIVSMMERMSNCLPCEGPLISLQHLTPENYSIGREVDFHIAMTTFETDSLPLHWQAPLRSMDEIIVFSEFNKQMFAETGIRRPIVVIPHGVDTVRFHPDQPPLPMAKTLREQDVFIFGSNFDWTARKNPEALIKAYFGAFKSFDPVCLMLKVYHQRAIDRSAGLIASKIDAIGRAMQIPKEKRPKIVLVGGMMSPDEMPSFYTGLDCYVLPSRGEGWSLTHSEAMSCGVPSIAVNWSGNTDFMNDTNSILLKNFKLREIQPTDEVPEHYMGHRWADCDVEELQAKMKGIFENRDLLKAIGMAARRDMVEKFTWQDCCKKLMNHLGECAQNLPRRTKKVTDTIV